VRRAFDLDQTARQRVGHDGKRIQWEHATVMTPDLYAIQYASSASNVLALLRGYVSRVRNGPVLSLLPEELEGLQVRDAADVEAWRSRLQQSLRKSPLNSSARCWIGELIELFSMASQRLRVLQGLPGRASAGRLPQNSPCTDPNIVE
jgi:hypothetical protein